MPVLFIGRGDRPSLPSMRDVFAVNRPTLRSEASAALSGTQRRRPVGEEEEEVERMGRKWKEEMGRQEEK